MGEPRKEKTVLGKITWLRLWLAVGLDVRRLTLKRIPPTEERFWSFVNKTECCWLWHGALWKGYGHFTLWKPSRHISAHRFAWELEHGPIPDGLFVCHDCPCGDTPRCVRPSHCFLGTQFDNMADAVGKGQCHVGEAASWSKLTEVQVLEIRRLYSLGHTYESIAKSFNIAFQTVGKIAKGKSWKHLPLSQ